MSRIKKIGYGRQSVSNEDIRSVLKALQSEYLTQGPLVLQFEKQICDYTGAKFCIALSSGTAALHLAVRALNIEKNRVGITSPNTFAASANCMIYNDLLPMFADMDAETYCIDPLRLEEKIGSETALVIPVHFAGHPCDMEKIDKIRQKNQLYVIEDAAHAIGSKYADGSMVGNCRYSDMTIFSFHPVKTITTGEGGAITTNNEKWYNKLKRLANHGIVREDTAFENQIPGTRGPLYYEMHDLGYNYRITDLQCALGISQLKRIDLFIRRRRDIVKQYNNAFGSLDELILPVERQNMYSSCHLYVIQLARADRSKVFAGLEEKGIHTNVHYIPVHLHPYYKKRYGYGNGDFPIAEAYYQKALTLPLFPEMSDEDVAYVIDQMKRILFWGGL